MDMLAIKTFIPILCIFVQRSDGAYNYSLEQDLRTSIFTTNSYNRFIPPDAAIKVYVSITVYTLNTLDIKNQNMETSMYIGLEWNDPRFKWSDKAEYSSISSIRSNSDIAWIPKIAIANSVRDLSVLGDENMAITAHLTGSMLWTIGKIDITQCHCDVTYYPFDTQSCELIVIGLGYRTAEVELLFKSNPLDMTFFSENGEWEYLRSDTSIDDRIIEDGVTIRQLKFKLTFRRRPLFQFMNYLIPITLLSCLTSLIFKLPADSGEKIGFCLTVLLAFAVYVTIVSDHIPTSSVKTSFLSLYLILILSLGVISVFITVFVLECHNMDSNRPIPNWLRNISRHVLVPLSFRHGDLCRSRCCCRRPTAIEAVESNKCENQNLKHTEKSSKDSELSWKEIGKIIDSFCFRLSLIINTIMAIITYSAFVYGYANA